MAGRDLDSRPSHFVWNGINPVHKPIVGLREASDILLYELHSTHLRLTLLDTTHPRHASSTRPVTTFSAYSGIPNYQFLRWYLTLPQNVRDDL